MKPGTRPEQPSKEQRPQQLGSSTSVQTMAKLGSRPHLFCFGLGYSARAIAALLSQEGWQISGTCRSTEKCERLRALGYATYVFDRDRPLDDPVRALSTVTDVVSSVPPDTEGDPVLDHHADALIATDRLRWLGYLSTTGVYGDTNGELVDESSPSHPTTQRSQRRALAERRWLQLHVEAALPTHIFRLAGIYGPGRSSFDAIRSGNARRVIKPGHLFSRIHVDDIAMIVRASMARPNPGVVYNVCDDHPAEQSEVVAYACALLGIEPPTPIQFEDAIERMTPMARSFWRDNRRVANTKLKRELGIRLQFPDYRSGLAAVLAAERARISTEGTDQTPAAVETSPAG